MMYTKEQMIDAYKMGAREWQGDYAWNEINMDVTQDAHKYVDKLQDAPPIAPEASTNDLSRSGHLPPNGTPEEVLARVLASLLCRTAMMFFDEETKQFPALFSLARQEAMLDALREAYPILGALEDARVEETV